MIEKIVLDYLNKKLSVECHMEKPENPPKSYVLIEKTSGSEENMIKSATLVIQSYAVTLVQAASLNEEVKKALRDIAELDDISKAKLNTDYNFTDTTTKKYRYQAVYDFIYF